MANIHGKLIKSGEYDLAVTYTTSGKADFETQYFYFLKAYEPTAFGHFEIEEMSEQVHSLLNSKTLEEYYAAVNNLQKLNEEYAVGLPLAYERVFYPYSTKNFTGWNSRTGTGVIHQGTWFELKEN